MDKLKLPKSALPEIEKIKKIKEELRDLARFEVLEEIESQGVSHPIYKVSFGSQNPEAPVLGLIGGVHGLERIGAQVCLSLMGTLSQLVLWDKNIKKNLEHIRIFFIPTVNPAGIFNKTRSNPNGVDLMRNAPITATSKVPFLLGGHNYASWLPWYRGNPFEKMEKESLALVEAVQKEIQKAPVSITVDFHSGYGLQDQIWFPYGKTKEAWPGLPVMHSFKNLLERTYPYHFYKIEPPAYLVHGDLWDYLYDWQTKNNTSSVYLPLTLEMGSWNWVKKNPLQFFSAEGPFNPIKSHRLNRTLRRHNTFFEFLIRAISSPEAWVHLSEEQKLKHEMQAHELWYDKFK